ncbi:MAG: hypothetical protein JSS43_19805 [Proteobacteria bacterium]|nr:hypothetical protein [Pseudomonadota bacterium]
MRVYVLQSERDLRVYAFSQSLMPGRLLAKYAPWRSVAKGTCFPIEDLREADAIAINQDGYAVFRLDPEPQGV